MTNVENLPPPPPHTQPLFLSAGCLLTHTPFLEHSPATCLQVKVPQLHRCCASLVCDLEVFGAVSVSGTDESARPACFAVTLQLHAVRVQPASHRQGTASFTPSGYSQLHAVRVQLHDIWVQLHAVRVQPASRRQGTASCHLGTTSFTPSGYSWTPSGYSFTVPSGYIQLHAVRVQPVVHSTRSSSLSETADS